MAGKVYGTAYYSVTVDTAGIDHFAAGFPEVTEEVAREARDHTAKEAIRLAPYRTGFLRRSIRNLNLPGRFVVIAMAYYALFVEYGTRFMAAQPFMRPAADSVPWMTILSRALNRLGFR